MAPEIFAEAEEHPLDRHRLLDQGVARFWVDVAEVSGDYQLVLGFSD